MGVCDKKVLLVHAHWGASDNIGTPRYTHTYTNTKTLTCSQAEHPSTHITCLQPYAQHYLDNVRKEYKKIGPLYSETKLKSF